MSLPNHNSEGFEAVDVALFFSRANDEARRYGADPWIFLREFVQNGRDAGAQKIAISYEYSNGFEILSCEDDGAGMDREKVAHFLLRLYASSKEREDKAIGFFGVGFWSCLLWKPREIWVESWDGNGTPVNLVIDCLAQQIRNLEQPLRTSRGTRISLLKACASDVSAERESEIRERLLFYVAAIRPLKKGELALYFLKERINCEFPLPEFISERVHKRDYDGVLGFGKKPEIRVYKGGILVRDLKNLDELIPSRKSLLAGEDWGVFPHVHVNIEGLKVLMNRSQVFEDPNLLACVQDIEARLFKLRDKILADLYPASFWDRFRLGFRRLLRGPLRFPLAVLLLWFGALWVGPYLKDKASPSAERRFRYSSPSAGSGDIGSTFSRESSYVEDLMQDWRGANLELGESSAISWLFEHDAPDGTLFRSRSLTHFEGDRGLAPERLRVVGPYRSAPTREGAAIHVAFQVSGRTHLVQLPTPPDYQVEAASLRLEGQPLPLMAGVFGEPLAEVAQQGRLRYRCMPISDLGQAGKIQPVAFRWPEPFRSAIAQARKLPVQRRVSLLAQTLMSQMRTDFTHAYDVPEGQDWIGYVLKQGRGDCDILNGLLVLALRDAGVSANLELGMIAFQGGVRSELHAWTRFYDAGWRDLDVSISDNSGNGAMRLPTPHLPEMHLNELDLDDLPWPPTLGQPFSEPQAGSQKSRIPFLANWNLELRYFISGLILAFLLWALFKNRHKMKRHQKMNENPELFRDLLLQHLHGASEHDPLLLRRRPAFPLLDGRRVSLDMLLEWMRERPLFSDTTGSPYVKLLEPGSWVLKSDHPTFPVFERLLPDSIPLEEKVTDIEESESDPDLAALEAVIRVHDPAFRLHYLPKRLCHDACLIPFQDASRGHHHFFFAGRSREAKRIFKLPEPELRRFECARVVVHRSSFFLEHQETLLQQIFAALVSDSYVETLLAQLAATKAVETR